MTTSSWFINIKDRHLCIPVQSSSVYFLHTPEQFYETLLQRIGSAKQRVVLSALYLGSDALEQRLVDCLAQAAAAAAPPPTATPDQEAGLLQQHDGNNNSSDGRQQRMLSVSILLDFFRATRGATTAGTSSTTMLAPLTANENVEVRLFHTPKLRGILKSVLSERVNEVVGLQHMKFFVFDDTVLITGANLSDQYFVNRQDRYLLIEHCPVLADFFVDLFHVVGAHSFRLRPDGHVDEFPGGPTSPVHPETGSLPHIQRQINDAVCKLFTKFKARVAEATAAGCSPSSACAIVDDNGKQYNNNNKEEEGTFVVPFLQMGLFNVNQEVELFSKLFSDDGGGGNNMALTLMTAYFNLSDTYADLILHKCRFPVNIVFASPKANGFLGADGLSGHIPSLYEHCALAFVRRTLQANQADRLAFAEWVRPGWTFHAKGLWVEERQQQQQQGSAADGAATASHCCGRRVATVVGSSNFGFRSAQRDLEAQLLLVTDNEALKGRIAEEKNSLLAHAEVLDPSTFLRRDCLIPAWLKYCARLFRNFF
uniref:CDP-diacylglycerol--glycerol-3-phosphate 3-phosphatidyltransferase n=1 Tax=Globodera rostochiensis TaxID=31243 RepID=A0A914HNJ4_GLORO